MNQEHEGGNPYEKDIFPDPCFGLAGRIAGWLQAGREYQCGWIYIQQLYLRPGHQLESPHLGDDVVKNPHEFLTKDLLVMDGDA